MTFENQNNQIEIQKKPDTLELKSVQIERLGEQIEKCSEELTNELCTKNNNVLQELLEEKGINFNAAFNKIV